MRIRNILLAGCIAALAGCASTASQIDTGASKAGSTIPQVAKSAGDLLSIVPAVVNDVVSIWNAITTKPTTPATTAPKP